MKNKIFKISVAIMLIMTLTMTNFIFLGASLVSYAADNASTNNKNIEFSAFFKDSDGNRLTTLERTEDMKDISLYLSVNVNKEGFFTGDVELSNANFTFASCDNQAVSKVESNKIHLNQLNAGTSTEVEIKITPTDKDVFDLNMLNIESELKLTGIYRDSREKDIKIDATRKVNLKLAETNSNTDVENSLKVITNKVLKISGEDKRVVQISMNMGLKNNNYPIKEIYTTVNVPEINGKMPEVSKEVNLNTMTASEYKNENGYAEITLKNEKTETNSVKWKKQGNENVILTYIYDANVDLSNIDITAQEKVSLYNDKEITSNEGKVKLSNEEIDSAIEVKTSNSENSIYKGKLYSAIDKQIESTTTLDVNLANVEEYISIKEENSKYQVNENETNANVYYNKTTINKDSFTKLFGEDGTLTISNENGEALAVISKDTDTDENGNVVIDYTGREPQSIAIKTSTPKAEGTLEIKHVKTIKPIDINTMKAANKIVSKVVYGYNNYNQGNAAYTKGIETEANAEIELKETSTEARLELNRDSLSTVVSNNIEMKLVLKTDDESKDLYKNPIFRIELPEQVESIQINKVDLLYEDELKVASCTTDGRYINLKLNGEQTSYKAQSIEGANVIIDATINVNKTSIAKPESINVLYKNEKANTYANGEEVGRTSKDIEVVAPKDVTAINSIKALNVETVGENDTNNVSLQRGTNSKQVEVNFEVINNNEENVQNVNLMGTFPTKTDENNIDIKVVDGIKVDNSKVYYTENENATSDLGNSANGWKEEISNPETVKKYLVVMDKIDSRTSVNGSYTIDIPENLEYNQTAKEGYEVSYLKGQAQNANTVKATTISMETGVGPKLESKLTATVGGQELTDTSKVKSGEVIKYKVQVSNVGSEDVTNVKVTGQIPEGTFLVQPVDNYEYAGTAYYKSVKADNYETTIDSLKKGEVKYVEYEVMVSTNTADNTSIANTVKVNYSDVNQNTNESKVSSETGNLRAMVKRITDRNASLYEGESVKYFAIIKNTSSSQIDNVKVKTNKSDNLTVETLKIITGLKDEEISNDDMVLTDSSQKDNTEEPDSEETGDGTDDSTEVNSEEINYENEVNIGTIKPGEVKVLSYGMQIGKADNNASEFSVVASDGQKEYKSNVWSDKINSFDVNMSIESNTESKYVSSGDQITYTIKIKNNGKSATSGITLNDEIPGALTINKVLVDGNEKTVDSNNVYAGIVVPANSEKVVNIETTVDYSESRTSAETITNKAVALLDDEQIATTSEINHIIKADVTEDNSNDDNNNSNNNGNNGENNGNIANGSQMISGVAWYDENGDGKKDSGEKTLSGITVKLLNVNTNQYVKTSSGDDLQTTTNENGAYVLDNIASGKYVVVFDYDKNQYSLTKYKVDGAGESVNSNTRLNELTIGDSKQEVASTDIINIDQENISDINIGLIQLKNFDLKLDKLVNKIMVQNSAGTTVKEYNNTTTAKIELDAKQIKGSTIIVEYNIVVTNVGEVAGYARNIADYMPSDLNFSSEMNKDWYKKDNTLYTTSIGNDVINPGESKTVTLTLTKTMGEDNVVARNSAEIYEAYNDLGLKDSNSTPGNKANGENDMGSADVIVSIRTGGVIYMTIGIVIAVVLVAGITAGIIVKRKNLKGEE